MTTMATGKSRRRPARPTAGWRTKIRNATDTRFGSRTLTLARTHSPYRCILSRCTPLLQGIIIVWGRSSTLSVQHGCRRRPTPCYCVLHTTHTHTHRQTLTLGVISFRHFPPAFGSRIHINILENFYFLFTNFTHTHKQTNKNSSSKDKEEENFLNKLFVVSITGHPVLEAWLYFYTQSLDLFIIMNT